MINAEENMLSEFVGKRVLFFFPHEDDEVNIAGSLLIQFSRMKIMCRVVYSTKGELFIEPERRIREAKNALKRVGILEDNVFFLDFPDTDKLDNILYDKEYQISRIKEHIVEYDPDYIITNDWDGHPNHIELSILVDEAINALTKENGHCRIKYLKTYAYDLAFFSEDDYSNYNLKSTIKPNEIRNPAFSWEERIRFPVSKEARKPIIETNGIYQMLWRHHSQSAFRAAKKVANSDKVFWQPRMDSIAVGSRISATSGDVNWLNDGICNNLNKDMTIASTNLWHPYVNDQQKKIRIEFEEKRDLEKIVIYESQNANDNILKAELQLSNEKTYIIDDIVHDGSASTILKEKQDGIEWIEFAVLEYEGDNYGLTEIQIFENKQNDIWFTKICINDNYVYDYYTDEEYIQPSVATYNILGENIDITDNITWIYDGEVQENNIITIAKKRKSVLRVVYNDNTLIGDEVIIFPKRMIKRKEWAYTMGSKLLGVLLYIMDWIINERFVLEKRLLISKK